MYIFKGTFYPEIMVGVEKTFQNRKLLYPNLRNMLSCAKAIKPVRKMKI